MLDRPAFMDTTETADYLGLTPGTVHNFRRVGSGPRYTRLGRAIRYRREDVDAWIARHTTDPEADQ